MTEFVLAAAVMLLAMVPIGLIAARGTVMEAVVAYEAATSILIMIFVLLPEGFRRPDEFEFPVLLAVVMLASALVFLRMLERWL